MKSLGEALERLQAQGLRRQRMAREAREFPVIEIEGREHLNFAANDYLALACEPRVSEALAAGARRWGAGAGAAHLISGHTRAHAEFEDALADFMGCEAALLFSTGYMANLGVVATLASRGDTVVEDKLNHASLIDAAVLARVRLLRYVHADASAAEDRLGQASGGTLLVTDGVFSMDGDLAPLPALASLAARADSTLVVDDAHGFGVLGEHGRGSLEHCGLDSTAASVQVVTLGKALGVFGAAVAGNRALIETLVQRARPWIYTTALPPALAAALSVSLQLMREEGWRRERVLAHVARFRAGCERAGLRLLESETPIQPIVVGTTERALAVSGRLAERGFYVPAIRPPTVPEGSARLRITLSAGHREEQVDALVAALAGSLAENE